MDGGSFSNNTEPYGLRETILEFPYVLHSHALYYCACCSGGSEIVAKSEYLDSRVTEMTTILLLVQVRRREAAFLTQ
jgi:hypothetical protein